MHTVGARTINLLYHVHKNCVHRKSPKNRLDAVPCKARRRLIVRQSRSKAFRVSKVELVVEMLVFPTITRRGSWRTQPAVVPPHTTVRPTYPRVSHGLCTSVESWKWNVLRCTRWRCVASGWKVGAALKSHRKCVPWFQLRLAAHASRSGHVAVIEQTALFSCGSWVAFSLGCQPGSYESAPFNWSVFGTPPLQHGPPLPSAGVPTHPQSRRR